jgi:class 3 adenylate cyclase/tetratricopeptide (TPR) repeat protein
VPRRERKIVTVLFADLVGFTSRAEELDPEDVEAILAPYHARLREELERHGGTVEKFIGDAVMAVFGAPQAHEDDPERAVRSALAIRDWALDQGGLEVRIAVNTGEALVNLEARPQEGEAMVAGDVVNTAARMQGAAPVNGVLVGETTRRATDGIVEYREAEPVAAKGKSAPVAVWEAVVARSRFGVDVVHGGAALVGRQRELALLLDALARAQAEREPQLVTIVGVPGIGKSRLVYELMQLAEAAPELIRWRQGRCLPYGDGVTFWALGEVVKSQAGIFETDEADRAEEKLAAMLDELVPGQERAWIGKHLRPLVGLVTEGGEGETEAFTAWIRYFEALADETPLVLVVEDLHWADDKLLDFLDELVERATDAGILLVATARPELLEQRPSWGGGKPNAVTLSLSPLPDEEVARLLAALLGSPVVEADKQQAVVTRAGGNPLFAEQYARMLAEYRGGGDLPLPESVQGIIAARLDALAPAEKALLQDGAVHGKVFWAGAVAAMDGHHGLETTLRALERKEFLRRQRRSAVAGETEYTFRHALLRDVAYGQIPRAERAEKHRRAAAWIETLAEGRDDHVELLADHYVRALELARAAGQAADELERSARLALRDTGARALRLYAFESASRSLERALELWRPEEHGWAEVLALRAKAAHFQGADDRIELLRQASDALVEAGEDEAAGELEALLAEAWWNRGDRERVFEHLGRAQSLVAAATSTPAKARVLSQLARYQALGGDAEALRTGQEALAMAEELGDAALQAHALNNIAIAYMSAGEFDAALAALERALELAIVANSPEAARIYNNLASVYGGMGEMERSVEAGAEAERLALRFGDRAMVRFRRANAAFLPFIEGDWDEALAIEDEFIAECEAGSGHHMEPILRMHRAVIHGWRGDEEGATAAVAHALRLAREVGEPQTLVGTIGAAIGLFAQLGRLADARRLALEALESHREHLHMGPTLLWLAIVADEAGLRDEVGAALAEQPASQWLEPQEASFRGDFESAAAFYEGKSFLLVAAYLRLKAAEAHMRSGDRARAAQQLDLALPFFRKTRATRMLRETEALLRATA